MIDKLNLRRLRELMERPGPVSAQSEIVTAALIALPTLLDIAEKAVELTRADVGAMHFADEASCRRFNDAINALKRAVEGVE